MTQCIDCGVELNPDNRSNHQPSIRCLACFEVFAAKTTAMFEAMTLAFDKQREE